MQFNFYVSGLSVIAPGVAGWLEFCDNLANQNWPDTSIQLPNLPQLPAAETRRMSQTIKLALAAANEAWSMAKLDTANIASLFASSNGDTDIMHYLGEILATKERAMSPTKFHHSLHNAPAGYWTIATKINAPSLAIAAGQLTFARALLEAALFCQLEAKSILLVAYDIEPVDCLKKYIPIECTFATALLLSPSKSPQSLARINMQLVNQVSAVETSIPTVAWQQHNPIAKSLPLLCLLAQQQSGQITLATSASQCLSLDVRYHD